MIRRSRSPPSAVTRLNGYRPIRFERWRWLSRSSSFASSISTPAGLTCQSPSAAAVSAQSFAAAESLAASAISASDRKNIFRQNRS